MLRYLRMHRICLPSEYRQLTARGLSPRKIRSLVGCSPLPTLGPRSVRWNWQSKADSIRAAANFQSGSERGEPHHSTPEGRIRDQHRTPIDQGASTAMTKLITIPKFARATGLPYRLCLHLVGTRKIPSVPVGSRRRIDVRGVEQWLAAGEFNNGRGRFR